MEKDFADYLLYLEGLLQWEERFRKFLPVKSKDSLAAYVLTNGL